jgi:hypothetical protein
MFSVLIVCNGHFAVTGGHWISGGAVASILGGDFVSITGGGIEQNMQ